MSLFSGTDLTCIRGENLVFAKLAFAVESGGGLLLIGPNGSGKSSLLRVLAGLLKPAAGLLAWDGEAVTDEPDEHHGRLHYVGHHDCIKPVLTVHENIAFWASLRNAPGDVETRIEMAFDMFDIGHLRDIPGRYLSAGQKRRANLARIIAAPAPVWLLDEPTTALDKASITKLEQAIASHRAGGGIVIVSTHQDIGLEDATILDMARFSARLAPGWHLDLDDHDSMGAMA
ncbi:heme ABC exporter ATP-binding protein CcmA [Magnetospira sp. QH-2]|uniref:heme ABC exporter ATP-binding protein CcmA n=1 Tax=Magnetospira sp. (strain QH-2) TaxID=1288970 RepID=UPI0003E81B01|nr:heme ABC exporter ATP-binding protein CcmA [Magnetospira sp. QH-2]CCQ75356.1 Cytochrome c biogenesis ATP-binding export protein CcmA [Magnetospira sp. QH-2]